MCWKDEILPTFFATGRDATNDDRKDRVIWSSGSGSVESISPIAAGTGGKGVRSQILILARPLTLGERTIDELCERAADMRIPAHDELLVVVAPDLGVIAGNDPGVRICGRAKVVVFVIAELCRRSEYAGRKHRRR